MGIAHESNVALLAVEHQIADGMELAVEYSGIRVARGTDHREGCTLGRHVDVGCQHSVGAGCTTVHHQGKPNEVTTFGQLVVPIGIHLLIVSVYLSALSADALLEVVFVLRNLLIGIEACVFIRCAVAVESGFGIDSAVGGIEHRVRVLADSLVEIDGSLVAVQLEAQFAAGHLLVGDERGLSTILAVAVRLRGSIAAVHIVGFTFHTRHFGCGPAVLYYGVLADPAGKLAVVGRSVYLARRVAVLHHRDGTARRAIGLDTARIDSEIGDGALIAKVEQINRFIRAREAAYDSGRMACS